MSLLFFFINLKLVPPLPEKLIFSFPSRKEKTISEVRIRILCFFLNLLSSLRPEEEKRVLLFIGTSSLKEAELSFSVRSPRGKSTAYPFFPWQDSAFLFLQKFSLTELEPPLLMAR